MTKARREAVLQRWERRCAYPMCGVEKGLEIDHVIPLELGGKDDESNLQLLCGAHHRQKTALDVKMIAKARRMRKKENPQDHPSAKKARIWSRGFDKSLTRTFSGTVRPRSR
jgi:5-methylcytosine-specific restriction endonuclease McrA